MPDLWARQAATITTTITATATTQLHLSKANQLYSCVVIMTKKNHTKDQHEFDSNKSSKITKLS